MAMSFRPHDYQRYAADRIVNDKAVGLMLDMGLGKTAIVLSAIAELLDRCDLRRVLVIAPKKVAEATWQHEAEKWQEFKDLRISTVLGTEKQRRDALAASADVYIINRENVTWLCDDVYGGKADKDWPFDMVVVDESSSFKNPQAKRFKSLKRKLKRIERMVILTGTPAPNGLEDLWSQVFLLDRGDRLGPNISSFRARWFDYNEWRHEYTPKQGAFEAVKGRIHDVCVSMMAKDYLSLPDMIVQDIPIELDGPSKKRYAEMEKQMVMALDDEEITAVNAAALTGKLLQLCSGDVYDEERKVHHVHDCKADAFRELLEALGGAHCLVFYSYQFEPETILRAIPAPLRACVLKSDAEVAAWNAGEVDVLLAHPASCGYGLNLQAGGHHVVWYTLTWSLELYQQANARLHRQGQTEPVIVHRLLVGEGADEHVSKALSAKDDVQSAILESIKATVRRYRDVK